MVGAGDGRGYKKIIVGICVMEKKVKCGSEVLVSFVRSSFLLNI